MIMLPFIKLYFNENSVQNFNGFEMGKVRIETNAALDKWIDNVESVHEKLEKSSEKSGTLT